MSETRTAVRKWTEADITVVRQEVEKADTAQKGFEAASIILGKTVGNISSKWYTVIAKEKKGEKGKPGVKPKKVKAKIETGTTDKHLSTGLKLMQTLLGSEMTATEIILRPSEMLIKF